MRNAPVLMLLLVAAGARADSSAPAGSALDLKDAPKQDAGFRRWVRKRAKERGWSLARWGFAQLDGDPAPERFAVLCKDPAGEDGLVVLVEDAPGRRWSFTHANEGHDACVPAADPKWAREAPPGIALAGNYHGGEETTWVALRRGRPAIVRVDTDDGPRDDDCFQESLDYDALERRYAACGGDEARAAMFLVDGEAGRYRSTPAGGGGEAPAFGVAVKAAGRQLRVAIKLERAARTGEAIEIWTTGSAGKPLAWSASWDGAHWQLRGLERAPRELPPITGDATSLTLPIVDRAENGEWHAHLTVVAVSSDGRTRVATSDLRPDDAQSLGHVVAPPAPLPDLQSE